MKISDLMYDLGVEERLYTQGPLAVTTPIDGSEIARVAPDDDAEIDAKIKLAHKSFQEWRGVPAPRRGELVRLFGDELRVHKNALGRLVSIECGKVLAEE